MHSLVGLSPKAPLINPSKPIRVTWNGINEPPTHLANSTLAFYSAGYQPATGDKIATIAGPLNDIVNTPFAIAVGTRSTDPAVNAFCRRSADDFVARWQKAQPCSPRVLIDTQVTADDIARYSLYLVGGADANAVTAKLAKELPLRIDKATITIAGRGFDVPDAAYQAIFPSPRNPERHVRVCSATSAVAVTRIWSIAEDPCDFGIVDARSGEPIACGIFDAHWRRTDMGTLVGKDAVRTNLPGPHVP